MAIDVLSRALQIDPTATTVLRERAEIQAERGVVPAALDDYAALIQAQPSNPALFLARGRVYALSGQPTLALSDVGAALQIDSGRSRCASVAGATLSRCQSD